MARVGCASLFFCVKIKNILKSVYFFAFFLYNREQGIYKEGIFPQPPVKKYFLGGGVRVENPKGVQ